MTVNTIDSDTYILTLELNEEIPKLGRAGETTKAEIFEYRGYKLIFVRIIRQGKRHFAFSSFEDLISACALCEDEVCDLTKLGDRYYVTAYEPEDSFVSTMCEFAVSVENDEYFDAILNEYGSEMIRFDAVRRIKKYFAFAV